MRTAKRTGIAALFAVFFALLLAGCLCLGLPAKREAQAAEGAVSEEEITYKDSSINGISTPAELMEAYKKVVAGQATEITLAGNIQLDMVNDSTITGDNPSDEGHLVLPIGVTFDLKGYTLNVIAGSKAPCCINIGQTVEGTTLTKSTVTIKNGTLIGQSSGHFAIVQAGSTLNLSNVDVQFEKDKGDGQTTRPAAVAVNGRRSDAVAAILNVDNVMFSKLENAVPVFVGDLPSDQGTVNFTNGDPLINLRDQINASSEYHKVETKLTGNINGSLVVPEYANITIDLNGNTITNTADEDTITNYGTLTIEDSSENDEGTVTNAGGSKAAIRNYGRAQLRGGTYTRTVAEGATASYYVIKNVGNMMIGSSTESGVKVTASDEYSSLIANGYYGDADKEAHVDKITVDNACTMIIYDGTFTGGMNVVKNDNEGVLTIHDGTFTNSYYDSEKKEAGSVIIAAGKSVTIYGGTFTQEREEDSAHGLRITVSDKVTTTVVVAGGTFTEGTDVYLMQEGSGEGTLNVTISNGTFNGNIQAAPTVSANDSLKITGGIFNATLGLVNLEDVQFTGGEFKNMPSASYFGSDVSLYVYTDGEKDGRFVLVESNEEVPENAQKVSVIGKTGTISSAQTDYYSSIKDALDAGMTHIYLFVDVEEDVTVNCTKSTYLYLQGNTLTGTIKKGGSTFYIRDEVGGGAIVNNSASDSAVTVTSGNLTLYGGFTIENTHASNTAPVIDFSGTKFTANKSYDDEGELKLISKGGIVLALADGTVAELARSQASYTSAAKGIFALNGTASVVVKAGTFNQNFSETYLDDGVELVKNADGTFSAMAFIAKVFRGEEEVYTSYTTVQEAIDNAQSGDTVVRYAEKIKENITIPQGKKLTLEISEGVVLQTGKSSAATVVNNGELTITGEGTIKNYNSAYPTAIDNYGTLTITGNVYVEGELANSTGGSIQVTGGTFSEKLPVEYLDEGIAQIEGADGNYTVGDYDSLAETADAVAVVKETGTAYTTLQDAIDAAGEGATVTLLKNVSESVTIEKDKNITLDLNGQTLTNAEGSHTITNYGTLTVMDSGENGTVDNVSHGRSAVFNEAGATAYLNNGTFTRSAEASTGFNNNGGNSYYVILNQGTMTIGTEAGTPEIRFPEGKGYYSSLVENGWYTASQNTNGATAKLTVFNGTFVGGKHSLKNDSYGELVIGNANVSGAGSCAILNWNDLTVNGGTFSGGEGAIYSAASSNDYEQGKSVITGGSFSGTLILDGAASYSISNGEFDTAFPSAYLAENAVLVKTAEGFKALDADSEAAKAYVAEVSDPDAETAVRYETLAAAINAAKDGDTVKLLANITNIKDNGQVVIKKNITLDFNGKTFTENAFVYAIVVDSATVTITSTEGKGTLEAKVNGIAIQNKADVTVSNISITSKYYGMLDGTLYDGRAVQIVNSTAVFENVDATTTANGVENNAVGWAIFNSEVTIKNSDISITYTRVEDQKENDNLQGYAVFASNSNVSITGTTITSSGDKIAYGVIFYGGMSMGDAAGEETTDNFKELTIDSSTITANAFAISGNGSNAEAYPYSGTSISITGNSKLKSEAGAAIYHPQYGELTIDGSEITGKTGIEMRAGNLTVKGGTITATGDPFESDQNGNGSTTDGAAIAIVQHTTKQKIDVQLAGGSYNGVRAVYQADLQENGEEAIGKIDLTITDGTYNGEVYSENLEDFIKGGAFSKMPKMDYFAENCIAEYKAETGKYETKAGSWVAAIGEEGYASLQDAINAAEDGETIILRADIGSADTPATAGEIVVDKAGAEITLDLKGKSIYVTNGYNDVNNGLKFINLKAGTLNVINSEEGGGVISASGRAFQIVPEERVEAKLVLGEGVKVHAVGGPAVFIMPDGAANVSDGSACYAVLESEADLSTDSTYGAIQGNGTAHGTFITIDGGTLSSQGNVIYHPQYGKLVINGGTFESPVAGVEVRAGELIVNGGTFNIGGTFKCEYNNNGATIEGAAIAVSQHTTDLPLEFTIAGGTFNSDADGKAFYQAATISENTAPVTGEIKGGEFNGEVGAATLTGFIEGGDFGVKPADELMNEDYAAEYVNGRYVAVPSTALKEARLAAQADVRAYAATMGFAWSDIVAAAEDESAAKAQLVLATYNAIAEAMSTLAVAQAKLDAMAAVDDYADAIEEAFAKLVADAIAEIKNEAAASEDRTAVVVPTATYAAIYAAETEAELTFLKDNALKEIDDIRAYRGEIAAQAEKLEALKGAIAAIDDSLFGTDEGAQGAIEAIQDAIKAAQEAITGGDETTSTSLKAIYEYLDGTLKGAVDGISRMLTDAVSEGGILYEMQETLEALDATVNGDGAEGPALLDQLTAAIEAAQNAINNNTAEGLDGAVEKITAAITAAQNAIIAALPDYEETLGEIAGSVDKLEELLGGTNGLAAIKKGIDSALAAIGTADGDTTLFEQLAAIESGNTAIKTTVDGLAAALTGTDGAIATLTAALTAMQGDITELTGALAEDTGWVAKDIAAAQAEIDKLTAAVGKLGTVDGKDLAAVVGEIADGLEEMDATVNSIASTVSAASAVEEAKTQAAADIRTWLEGYLEELAGDTAQADVLARAAYTAETTEGELYKDISAQFGEENGKLVLKYYNEALAAIDAATTVSDVTTAVATFRAQVASIEASAGNSTDLTVVYVLLGVVLLVLIIACIVALVKGGRQPEPAPAQAAPAEAKSAEAQPEEKAEEKEEQAEEAAPAEEPAGETAPAEEESAAAEDDDKERVVISANVRTFDEAYEDLTDEQRELFNKVKEYALAKEDAVEVKQSGGVVIKRKSKQIVKLTVRRDMPVALFLLENEMLKDFRRNAKSEAKLKVRATELVIREADDLETAYTMVDLSVEQIEKDLEAAKERRREARRQRRLQRQAEEAAAEQAEGAGEPAPAEEPASAESAATDGTDTE